MLKSNAIGAFPFPKVLSWTLRNLYDSVVNEIKTGHFLKMKIHTGVIYFQNSIKKILFADTSKLLFNFNTVYFTRAKKVPNLKTLPTPNFFEGPNG